MKKSLLTIAVASSLAVAGAAQAETKVYGHAQVEIGSWGGDVSGMSVDDKARGRIGVKNSEDLGNGLKSIAVMEFKVDTADGDADSTKFCTKDDGTCGAKAAGISLQKRTMMVGVKGGFGQVELGRLKSAYKYYGGVKYDPFVASLLEARGNGGMSGKVGKGNAYGHNSFISDSIGYQNKVGSIAFRVTYDADDGGPYASGATGGANGMTAGAAFTSGKTFQVGVAIANDGEAGNAEYSATKFFGFYNLGKGGKISGQMEASSKGTKDVDTFYVDYQYKMGKANVIDVAIGHEDDTTIGGTDKNFTRLAFIHNLSKKTRFTVGYASSEKTTNNVSTDASVIAVGIRKKF